MPNLTNRPPYQKGTKAPRSRGKARAANKTERTHWEAIRALGCILRLVSCKGKTTIHHCGTGGGGRKDHMRVIPLCHEHHLGREGIDGKRMSKRKWQDKYGHESVLLKRAERRLSIEEAKNV